MLELYHWEANGACARVLITLKEKGLDFKGHYVDLLAFEQHGPDFLKLNESGEAPVLVVDGRPMFESSYICEYLDEAHPTPALMPSDPLERWAARVWQKNVDDYIAASVSDLAWSAYGQAALEERNRGRNAGSIDEAVARIPSPERRVQWEQSVAGLDADRLEKSKGRMADLIARMDKDIARGGWLAGSAYSLADIAVYPYAAYLPGVAPELLNAATAPHVTAWLEKVAARPAVKAAEAHGRAADPYRTAAPGPEHVRWG